MIREEDAYSGVRVSMGARLASANLPFHVDVNVGDPIWPAPSTGEVPRLRGGEPIVLAGYPIHMVHAEKIVTAIQRGVANTRWRDFGDIWTLSRRHPVSASDLRAAIDAVGAHRGADLAPLTDVLDGYADLGQARWIAWRRRSNSDHLPESFAEVLRAVITFADPGVGPSSPAPATSQAGIKCDSGPESISRIDRVSRDWLNSCRLERRARVSGRARGNVRHACCRRGSRRR